MDLLAYGFYGAAISIVCEDDGVTEVWVFVGFFGVDPNEVEMLPDLFKQAVEVELHVAADDHGVGLLSDHVDFLHGNGVDLVVAVQTLDVLSIP